MPNNYVIYIPIPSRKNFDLALTAGIWGSRKDVFGELRRGDTVAFVQEVKGSLRVKALKPTVARRVVTAQVTSRGFRDTSGIWPDDTYPFRFKFEVRSEEKDVGAPGSLLNSSALEAIRLSGNSSSSPRPWEPEVRDIAELYAEFEDQVVKREAEPPSSPEPPTGNPNPAKQEAKATAYVRDPEVVAFTRRRANFRCEVPGCRYEPFLNLNGRPFVEVHHLQHLAEGGPDTPDNTACLCPNHHREIHFSSSREELLERLRALRQKR